MSGLLGAEFGHWWIGAGTSGYREDATSYDITSSLSAFLPKTLAVRGICFQRILPRTVGLQIVLGGV